MWLQIVSLLVFLGAVLILSLSVCKKELMEWVFIHVSYYILWGILFFFIYHLRLYLRSISFSFRAFLKRNMIGVTGILFLSGLVFGTLRTEFKILSDETNLLGVSRSMTFNKTSFNITTGDYRHGVFNPESKEIPKRPLLFSFLVHLFHNVFGYHSFHPFVLNFLILTGLLFFFFKFFTKFGSVWTGMASVFLVLSEPIVSITATSGSFDLLSVFLFVILMVVVFLFLEKPSSESFAFLWVVGVLYSHSRYESFAIFLIVVVSLGGIKSLKKVYFTKYPFLYGSSCMMFLPLILQRLLKTGSYQNPLGVSLFGYNHLIRNLTEFFQYHFHLNLFYPYAGLLHWVSCLAGLVSLFFWIKNKRILLRKNRLAVFVLPVLVLNMIYFSHFSGKFLHPSSARFFIILSLFFASILPFLSVILNKGSRLLFWFSVFLFLYYHPVSMSDAFTNSLLQTRRNRCLNGFFKDIPVSSAVIYTDRPGQLSVFGYSCFRLKDLKKHYMSSRLQEKYSGMKLYVVQNVFGKNNEGLEAGFSLPLKFEKEYIISNNKKIRILSVQV